MCFDSFDVVAVTVVFSLIQNRCGITSVIKMTSMDCSGHRTIIKLCFNLARTPTHEMLEVADAKPPASRALVFKWHKRFKEGQKLLKTQVPYKPLSQNVDTV